MNNKKYKPSYMTAENGYVLQLYTSRPFESLKGGLIQKKEIIPGWRILYSLKITIRSNY